MLLIKRTLLVHHSALEDFMVVCIRSTMLKPLHGDWGNEDKCLHSTSSMSSAVPGGLDTPTPLISHTAILHRRELWHRRIWNLVSKWQNCYFLSIRSGPESTLSFLIVCRLPGQCGKRSQCAMWNSLPLIPHSSVAPLPLTPCLLTWKFQYHVCLLKIPEYSIL